MANNCTKVNPYWSTRKGETEYHVCSNCTVGNNIEADYLKSGFSAPAGYTLCSRCKKIQAGEISR